MHHEISNRRFKKSKVVKLMLMPTGPLTQFMLSPLKSPPTPCSLNTVCVMANERRKRAFTDTKHRSWSTYQFRPIDTPLASQAKHCALRVRRYQEKGCIVATSSRKAPYLRPASHERIATMKTVVSFLTVSVWKMFSLLQ